MLWGFLGRVNSRVSVGRASNMFGRDILLGCAARELVGERLKEGCVMVIR